MKHHGPPTKGEPRQDTQLNYFYARGERVSDAKSSPSILPEDKYLPYLLGFDVQPPPPSACCDGSGTHITNQVKPAGQIL